MKKVVIAAAALAAATALAVSSCSGPSSAHAQTSTGDQLSILATFYPLQFVAEEVGGPYVQVDNLTPAGAEPHDLELTTRNILSLESADLIVTLSDFQPAVDDALAEISGPKVLDASSLENQVGTEAAADAHADEHAHSHEDRHAHSHAHSGPGAQVDPHFWLDPTRVSQLAARMANNLATLDPAHAQTYRTNASRLEKELASLDDSYRSRLSECAHDSFIVSHEAFGYLATRYHLHQIGIAGLDPENEPSPARLQQVAKTARSSGATTVFTEQRASAKVASALATELGLRTERLNTLETVLPGEGNYLTIMKDNLNSLATALECR